MLNNTSAWLVKPSVWILCLCFFPKFALANSSEELSIEKSKTQAQIAQVEAKLKAASQAQTKLSKSLNNHEQEVAATAKKAQPG